MATKQINLKISENLFSSAKDFAESYGYKNIQDLVTDSLREKIYEKSLYDESFSEKEISLIDSIIEKSLKSKKFVSKKELEKALK